MRCVAILLLAVVFLSSFVYAGVYINEVEANPEGSETNEWVELYNSGNVDIDLSEWKIIDVGGIEDVIPFGTIILTKGFWVFTEDISSLSIDNSNEQITLKDKTGEIIDITPLLNDGGDDNNTNQRIPDGVDNWEFKEQTKGKSNSPQESTISFSLSPLIFGSVSQGGSVIKNSVITLHEPNNVDLSFEISLEEGSIFENLFFDLNGDDVSSDDEQLDETLNYDVDDLEGEFEINLPVRLNIPFGSVAGKHNGKITYTATEKI